MGFEETPIKQHKQIKAGTPQKEKKMKTKSTEPKAPRTIKIKTLVIVVAILFSHVGAFVGGIVANNAYNDMIEAQAFERAQHLLKSDGKQ